MSSSIRIVFLGLAAALAGCSADPAPAVQTTFAAADALRLRSDVQRGRAWVLGRHAVSVHESLGGRELARVALPGWLFVDADIACPPDLALDAAGSAYVSSNVVPVLWRIDGQSFEVTRIDLALDADRDMDVGFSALAVAGEGRLLAASTLAGSLWSIDPRAATAAKLQAYRAQPGVCESFIRGAPRSPWASPARP